MLTYNKKHVFKKDNNNQLDMPESSIFGAEICDLISLYVLDSQKHIYITNKIGLYKDDNLTLIEGKDSQYLKNKNIKTINYLKILCLNPQLWALP